MRYRLKIALLAFGTVVGFGSGFASLACHRHHQRQAFERHVASVCVEATQAEMARMRYAPPPPPPPAQYGWGRW